MNNITKEEILLEEMINSFKGLDAEEIVKIVKKEQASCESLICHLEKMKTPGRDDAFRKTKDKLKIVNLAISHYCYEEKQ